MNTKEFKIHFGFIIQWFFFFIKWIVGTLSGWLIPSTVFKNYYLYLVISEMESYLVTAAIKMELWEVGGFCCGELVRWHSLFILAAFSFLPLVHILLVGQAVSALYCWNSELNQFSFILEAPSAHDAASVTVKSLNSSKHLIALAGAIHSHTYELAYVSSQSDFIPR